MNSLKRYLWLVILFSQNLYASTYAPSYPYTQHIKGQKVIIKSQAYAPYEAPYKPLGNTKVYYAHRLLYTIDRYYAANIFTSDNGEIFVVVNKGVYVNKHSSTVAEAMSEPAIEIYRMGKLIKTYSFADVTDSLIKYPSYGQENYYYWHYYHDSAAAGSPEYMLNRNTLFVHQNALFMLTNLDKALKLNLVTLALQKLSFNSVVPDKKAFDPPAVIKKEHKIKLHKFDPPHLIGRKDFKTEMAQHLNREVAGQQDKDSFTVFADIVVDRRHRAEVSDISVYDTRIRHSYATESRNDEMEQAIRKWVIQQKYQTRFIPRFFDKYCYNVILNLK